MIWHGKQVLVIGILDDSSGQIRQIQIFPGEEIPPAALRVLREAEALNGKNLLEGDDIDEFDAFGEPPHGRH